MIIMPAVVFGGVSVLSLLIAVPAYTANPFRQDLWRAGHAHAGVLLVLSLIALRYVDEARLGERARWFVRLAFPAAAILLPAAFFLSVLDPAATEPNALIFLAYAVAVILVARCSRSAPACSDETERPTAARSTRTRPRADDPRGASMSDLLTEPADGNAVLEIERFAGCCAARRRGGWPDGGGQGRPPGPRTPCTTG